MVADITIAVRQIADRIRIGRILRKLSISDLSRLSGVHRSIIWRFEHGERTVTINTAMKLCHGLGVSLKEILSYQD